MFLGYDLLAQRYVRYAYVYPFAEAISGVLMIAGGALKWVAIRSPFVIGAIGAASVFKSASAKLADTIIEAQVREIGEMKKLIADLEANPTPTSAKDLAARAAD